MKMPQTLQASFPLFLALLFCASPPALIWAQSPATSPAPLPFNAEEALQQAKALWATQGDRDAAAAKFEHIIATLESPTEKRSDAQLQILCTSYNWLSVVDDRNPSRRNRVVKHLETILKHNPDFEVDKTITNARLQKQFEDLRSSKLVKVKFILDPEGGHLVVNDVAIKGQPIRHLSPGSKSIRYEKPGFESQEKIVELTLKESKQLEYQLVRKSSTITFQVTPPKAELFLDGKPVGQTTPHDENPERSAPFTLANLSPGKHLLGIKSACFQNKLFNLDPSFSEPFVDHLLEPIQLEPSQAFLTLDSPVKEGTLLINGENKGKLPVQELQICAGVQDIEIHYPLGAFHQRIDVSEGARVQIKAQPKARLRCVGIDSPEDFTGRKRFEEELAQLQKRLTHIIYLPPEPSPIDSQKETPKPKGGAELTLRFKRKSEHELEAVLSTLQNEEEATLIRILDEDPLKPLLERINTLPPTSVPSLDLQTVDLPGTAGAWVLQAGETATRAGLVIHQAITRVDGRVVANTADFQKALQNSQKPEVALHQGEKSLTLKKSFEPILIPKNAGWLSYPSVITELRLRLQGCSPDERGALLLNQAVALMNFERFDKAMECLREARISSPQGISQGTVDYLKGTCLLRLGSTYRSDAIQAFQSALSAKQATLWAPDGPLICILAQEALKEIKP